MKTLELNINRKELESYTIDILNDLKGYFTDEVSELHNEIFNTDYYIVGTYEAKRWIGEYAFDIINTIKEYEQDNFGQVTTDLSDPEKVVNMYVYIVGEDILNNLDSIRDHWDEYAGPQIIQKIIDELQLAENTEKLKASDEHI